jgi:hypothetical protein
MDTMNARAWYSQNIALSLMVLFPQTPVYSLAKNLGRLFIQPSIVLVPILQMPAVYAVSFRFHRGCG